MFSLICILLIIILYFLIFHPVSNKKISEGFRNKASSQPQDIIEKTNTNQIYDKFYANLYDELFDSKVKNEFECMFINKDFIPKKKSDVHILDAGCGTGQHLKILSRYKLKLTGLDQSSYMLKEAKKKLSKHPNVSFKQGDFLNKKLFPKRTFTHILCMFYTIYYNENINQFFQNCNSWLKPQGYLFIHTINRDKFDPVLEKSSSLIPFFDPQKHTKKRNTKTQLFFDSFGYSSDWSFKESGKTVFAEEFTFKDLPYTRKNQHIFYYVPQNKILKIAKKHGFQLVKSIDELTIGFGHNYILCFQKKYGQ